MAKRFKLLWNALWIKTEATITNAEQPIWNWVGAVLQVREVLRVLQQSPLRAKDLEEKALDLAAQLLVLCWVSKFYRTAYKLAKDTLVSWKALEKLQAVIKAQKWENPTIWSEELVLWQHTYEVLSEKNWKVKSIDMKYLNMIARTLWAPSDLTAWVFLHKKLWDKVKAWEVIMTCYANSEHKMEMAKEFLEAGKGSRRRHKAERYEASSPRY